MPDGTTAQFPMGTLTKQGGWWHGPRGSWGDQYLQAQYAEYLKERVA